MSELLEHKIDISRGMLMGQGVNLRTNSKKLEDVFIPWKSLNSHFMCFGTTRMGKTRLLAFMMRQIIEKGDHLIFIEPKGSENQESVSWLIQYALQNESIEDIVYWSPEHPDRSMKINLLYGQNDEEATSTMIGAMKVEDEFYEDIANEILMTVLPALTFLEELHSPMFLEIMERMEYLKVTVLEPINDFNKQMLGDYYDAEFHEVKDSLMAMYENKFAHDKEFLKKIELEYRTVVAYLKNPSNPPVRRFVTFEDLSRYSTPASLEELKKDVSDAIKSHSGMMSVDTEKRGKKAHKRLEELSQEDAGFYSKVTKSYKVTLTRLSTGNVGKLLCDSKINILKDKFYTEGKRVIMIAQPFPMVYEKAANMSIKMLMSMMNNLMGAVGISGVKGDKQIHVMIDEAGSIANNQMQSLANKGGGLGISLYLFSQSFADYKDTLGEDGATILADNANSKAFFLVNDDQSQETISAIIGSKKKGDATYGSSAGESSRVQSKAVEESLVPPSLIGQLEPMSFALKTSNSVYLMAAPFQRDPAIVVEFPYEDRKKKANKYNNFIEEYKESTRSISL